MGNRVFPGFLAVPFIAFLVHALNPGKKTTPWLEILATGPVWLYVSMQAAEAWKRRVH